MTNSIVSSIVKSYKGRAIRINPDNQYVCLTDMAAASGKLFHDWYRLKSTNEYLTTFSSVTGIPLSDDTNGSSLLIVLQGLEHGNNQGTWAHPKIAIRFAQWCSVEFAIQVDFWIDELLTTGKVLLETKPQPLPSRELAVETAVAIDRIQDILSKSNPRLAQILIDCAMNDVVDLTRPAIAASTQEFPDDKWYGLVQIADKMGIKTNSSTRVKLGQCVGKLGLERIREERLCNGQFEQIWCYRDDDKTRSAIQMWADSSLTIA